MKISVVIPCYNEEQTVLQIVKKVQGVLVDNEYEIIIIDDFSTDAGEPRGSAGLPILNELKSKKLINTVIYIIRYFGGSKLGIPGLIKSYSITAENTLDNSILIHYQLTHMMPCTNSYLGSYIQELLRISQPVE